jgi:glycosyltransferase involved in cell wall biosynthesis
MEIHKPTLTVGIPAYNEAANIRQLVLALLNQVLSSATLDEIIVVTDGCTDNTVEQIKSINDHRIKIIERSERQGLVVGQNEIIRQASGDILVLLDGDVLPKGSLFLETIIQPILADPDVGMVGADTTCAAPKTFIERVIAESHSIKSAMYRTIHSGNNIYLCHGRARAFSRRFYESLVWPIQHPEDSYSYLYCVQKHFKFVYLPTAQVIFRSPQNLADHLRQSLRFVHGRSQLIDSFPSGFAQREYAIPFFKIITTSCTAFFKHPVLLGSYALITAWGRLTYLFNHTHYHSMYEPSITSKKI